MIKCAPMEKEQVIAYPNSVLSQKAQPVKYLGKEERKLIQCMIQVMYAKNGVGIAAPQVGVSVCIFIANPSTKRSEETVYINPILIASSGSQVGPEGCLSLPDIGVDVRRASEIELEYMNKNGKTVREKFSKFNARVLQHELDHLNGKLIIDRVDFDERQRAMSEYQGR